MIAETKLMLEEFTLLFTKLYKYVASTVKRECERWKEGR